MTNAPTAVYPIKVKVTNHTNGISDSVFTNSSGLYSVNTIPGIVTAQTYSPSTYAGISTFDLVILSTHRQKTNLMLCPLSRIAADVNKDSKITVTDEDIIRELILGIRTSLPVPPWQYVPRAYVIPSQSHPDIKFTDDFWNNTYADSNSVEYPFNAILRMNGKVYSYTGANSWMTKLETYPFEQYPLCGVLNYGFFGVASADLNYSAPTSSLPPPPPFAPESDPSLGFDRILTDQVSTLRLAAERYEIKVLVTSKKELMGYQFGIKFDDKNYQFEKVKEEKQLLKQTSKNFGLLPKQTDKGEMRVLWYVDGIASKASIASDREFEALTFNIKVINTGIGVEKAISMDDSILQAEFIGKDGNLVDRKDISLVLKIRPLLPSEE